MDISFSARFLSSKEYCCKQIRMCLSTYINVSESYFHKGLTNDFHLIYQSLPYYSVLDVAALKAEEVNILIHFVQTCWEGLLQGFELQMRINAISPSYIIYMCMHT